VVGEREITRTASYMVLTRERGTALYAHLLVLRREVVKLRDHTDGLRNQLEDEQALLRIALHQLARELEKEPRSFSARWLATQRGLIANGDKGVRL